MLAYRAATGTLLWTRKYAFANALSYDFNDSGAFPVNHDEQIAIGSDGRTVVTIEASAKVRHNPDYLTIAYRA